MKEDSAEICSTIISKSVAKNSNVKVLWSATFNGGLNDNYSFVSLILVYMKSLTYASFVYGVIASVNL